VRQLEGHLGQAPIQRLTHASRGHPRSGGADEPNVDVPHLGATESQDRLPFDDILESSLRIHWNQLDPVEKECAVMRRLDEPALASRVFIVKMPWREAKKLRVEQSWDSDTAVDRDEGVVRSNPRTVNEPSEEAFARAGTPPDQNRRPSSAGPLICDQPTGLVTDRADRLTLSDQLSEEVCHDGQLSHDPHQPT
jgi:hypothetical protein